MSKNNEIGVTKNLSEISPEELEMMGIIIDPDSPLGKDITKYGKEHFSFEIVSQGSRKDCLKKQKELIKERNTLSPNGYNIPEDLIDNKPKSKSQQAIEKRQNNFRLNKEYGKPLAKP